MVVRRQAQGSTVAQCGGVERRYSDGTDRTNTAGGKDVGGEVGRNVKLVYEDATQFGGGVASN